MNNIEFLKSIYPEYKSPVCAECGKEVNLTMQQIQKMCLVSEKDFLEGKFKGLCPECTQRWLNKRHSTGNYGFNAKIMIENI